ncbi:MAG: hypothetical protein AVDCRST_MAG77-630, partial [uncultured Chloroflexi bacterium]
CSRGQGATKELLESFGTIRCCSSTAPAWRSSIPPAARSGSREWPAIASPCPRRRRD